MLLQLCAVSACHPRVHLGIGREGSLNYKYCNGGSREYDFWCRSRGMVCLPSLCPQSPNLVFAGLPYWIAGTRTISCDLARVRGVVVVGIVFTFHCISLSTSPLRRSCWSSQLSPAAGIFPVTISSYRGGQGLVSTLLVYTPPAQGQAQKLSSHLNKHFLHL